MEIARAVIVIVLKITIVLIMVSMGLQIRPRALLELWRRPRTLVGGLVAAFVVVPLATMGVFQIIPLTLPARVGLWVVAITPGAPMIYRTAERRRLSDPELAASFQVTVALLVIVFAPLWLAAASALSGSRYWISPFAIVRQVFIIQLIPILVGVFIHRVAREFAERAGKVIARVGFLILIPLIVAILALIAPSIARSTEAWELAATVLVALSAVIGGHLLAGPDAASRLTIASANVQRNPGLALTIAAWNFPDLRGSAMLVIIVYALIAAITGAVYRKIMDKRHPAEAPG